MIYKVLFVDDDLYTLEIIKRKVLEKNLKLYFAESGEKAIKIMEQEDIAVIFSDLRMPEINGVTLLGYVKEKFPSIIRVVMSHMKDINTISVLIRKDEIFRYIQKPIMYTEEFLPAIEAAVGKYIMNKENNENFSNILKVNEELKKEKDLFLEKSEENKNYRNNWSQLFTKYSDEVSKLSDDVIKYLNLGTPNECEKNNLIENIKYIEKLSSRLKSYLKEDEIYEDR